MTKDQKQSTDSRGKKGASFNAPAAAVVGAVVGAAAGYALSKSETRAKISEVITDIQKRSGDLKESLAEQAETIKDGAVNASSKMMENSTAADRSKKSSQSKS